MKFNKWTLGLAAIGVVSLASAVRADEQVSFVKTALTGTTISGYINTSIQWTPGYGNAAADSAYAFSGLGAKNDGFNLDVIDLTIEKPLDESEWASGYKAELWFGPDANLIPAVGPFRGANGLGTTSAGGLGIAAQDFAIKQAYIALRTPLGNGIDWKIGVFDTVIGYESLNAGDNPNYTRSWGNTIEPTEHTGILGTYRFNDIVSASLGIANTWNGTINGRAPASSMKTYMASIALTAPESFGFLKGGMFYAGVVDGRTAAGFLGGGTSPDRTSYYVGAVIPTPVEELKLGLAWDHLSLSDRNGFQCEDTDALAAYASFKVTDKVTVHGRLESLWLGGDGTAPAHPRGATGDLITGGGLYLPGDHFWTTTITVDYALWKNVISRVEYRWDHDDGDNGGKHFGQNGAGNNNQHLLALNVIYKF